MTDDGAVARGWDTFLTERDRAVFAKAGYGGRQGFGQRPVLLVVDVNKNFCGDRRLPILESLETWRASCGEEAWDAIAHIQRLIAVSRERRLPVVFTTMLDWRQDGWDRGRFADKNQRGGEDRSVHAADGNDLVPELGALDSDLIVRKQRPSAFHGTMLQSYLTDLGADSLVLVGTTTSGCVRATVVDAFSYGYKVTVVEQGTFDRGQASHWINLFDLHQKYADVVDVEEVLEHLGKVPDDLFTERMPSLARG
jgi:nicotinamidase-related amidase